MSVKPRQSKAVLRKKLLRKILIGVVIVIAVVIAIVVYLQRKVKTQFASSGQTEVESTQVTKGSVTTTVSGSGTLSAEDVEDIEVPDGVELDEVLKEVDDTVAEGDLLATVKEASVLSAMSDVQTQIDALDEKLEDASEDEVSSKIKAGMDGRVKAIYVEDDDDVSTVMAEHGALMILSLDGKMSVEIEAEGYEEDDKVTVVTSDGTEYTGKVSAVSGSTVTVLITDNGPSIGDKVTVDGKYSGTLAVHEPLKITGYAGTVSDVKVSLNKKVSDSTTLITLTDTSYSANYNSILEQREDLEEDLQTLVQIQKNGGVTASLAGRLTAVPDEDDDSSSSSSVTELSASASSDTSTETKVFSIDPQKTMSLSISVDETDILSLETGQEASVTLESDDTNTYSGTVTEVNTTASSGSGVTSYTAVIEMERTDDMLTGMTATANVTIEGVEDALILPEEAVNQTSSTAYVYTTYDEESGELGGMTEVTVGLSNGTSIEITEGLSEGDTVYYTASDDETGFGNFGGGNMPEGMEMPNNSDSSGGNMPGGGNSGGGMPSGRNGGGGND